MDVLTPDDYYIEVWLKVNPVTPVTDDQSVTLTVDNDSLEEHQSIFPSTGLIGFTIDDNIDSETGEVIPVITFDQFEDQFDDMMAQMWQFTAGNAVESVAVDSSVSLNTLNTLITFRPLNSLNTLIAFGSLNSLNTLNTLRSS